MRRTTSCGLGLCCTVLLAGRLVSAQVSQAGDVDLSGRVLAKLSVTIAEPNAYGHPVSGLRFLVAAENGDRVSIRTDDAGIASAWLRPATYRFVTPDPLTWQKTVYTWDVVVPIRPGTGTIRLSQENASNAQPVGRAAVPPMEAVSTSAEPVSAAVSRSQLREGFWFNLGLGYGSLGCDACDGYTGGLSGGLSLGSTFSQRYLLGVGTSGWVKSEGGATLSAGTLDARLRFYPSVTGGFFLTGGIGLGSVSLDLPKYGSAVETGVGVLLGIGMDFRLADNFSVTPFWSGVGISTSQENVRFGQIGVGLTFH